MHFFEKMFPNLSVSRAFHFLTELAGKVMAIFCTIHNLHPLQWKILLRHVQTHFLFIFFVFKSQDSHNPTQTARGIVSKARALTPPPPILPLTAVPPDADVRRGDSVPLELLNSPLAHMAGRLGLGPGHPQCTAPMR